MVNAIKLSKYVIPRPDKGIIGVALPAGILLGGYLLLTKLGVRIPFVSDAVDSAVIPVQHVAQDIKTWAEDQRSGASGASWFVVGPMSGLATLLGSVIDFAAVAAMGGVFFLSKDTGRHGDIIGMAAQGLKPGTALNYGWKSNVNFPGYEMQYVSNADGTWYGPAGTSGIVIDPSTPANQTYKVYLDQRPWGGGYGERDFRVIS